LHPASSALENILYPSSGTAWWLSDEDLSLPLRMGLLVSHPGNIMYGQFYGWNLQRFAQKALNEARFNARIHYHGYNATGAWGVDFSSQPFLDVINPSGGRKISVAEPLCAAQSRDLHLSNLVGSSKVRSQAKNMFLFLDALESAVRLLCAIALPESLFPEVTPLKSARPASERRLPRTGLCPLGGMSGNLAQKPAQSVRNCRSLSRVINGPLDA
jgi:hypothetical protein